MDSTSLIIAIVCLLIGLIIGLMGFVIYQKLLDDKVKNAAQREADRIINKAKSQASKQERDAKTRAKDFEIRARKNVEAEIKKEKQKMQAAEDQLKEKERRLEREIQKKKEDLQKQLKEAEVQAESLQLQEKRLIDQEKRLEAQIQEISGKLESIAAMSSEQAKEELKKAFEEDARREALQALIEIEEQAKKEAREKSKQILAAAIARYASEVSTEKTTTTIPLASDEMKGKIIGREGRNIRALEAACGVDLIVDEAPEGVIISSFDSVRREIARKSLQRLMEDGRIHPARIEEVVEKVKSEFFESMKEEAEKVCFEMGVHGVHPSVLNVLGSLKYRQAESQNLLAHAQEVAQLCGLMATEIGFDEKKAKRAGLLCYIGRGLDHSFEGNYVDAGCEFLRKNGEKADIIDAIQSHNAPSEPITTLGHLLQASVNLARSRPGARKGMMETYIKRLQDLESVANSFDGVTRSFAVQAGKEIRVLVDSGKVTDEQSVMLSKDIARKIEKELNYQGQIKVAVLRETRIVEHAR